MSQRMLFRPFQSLNTKKRLHLLIAIFLIVIGNTCQISNSQGILPNTLVNLLWEHWIIFIFSLLFISSGILIWIVKCQSIVEGSITNLIWWRLVLVIFAVIFLASGSTIFGFIILGNVQSPWAIIMPLVLNALGVFLMLLQWIFPVPTIEPLRQISSLPHLETNSIADSLIKEPSTLGKTIFRNILGNPPPTYSGIILERGQTCEIIYNMLLSDDISALALTGITKIGKSTLAAQIYTFKDKQAASTSNYFTDEALWLTIDADVTMADLSGTLFKSYGESLINFESLAPSNQALELINLLQRSNMKRLVILDQLDKLLDEKELRILKPGISEWLDAVNSKKCTSRLLITSNLWPKGASMDPPIYMQEYKVKNLDSVEGISLLRNQGKISDDEKILEECVKRCGGHTGMLKEIASLLRDNPNLDMINLLNNPEYAYYWRSIAYTIIKNSYDHLDILQRDLLLAFSIDSSPVPFSDACTVLMSPNISKTEIRMAIDSLLEQHLLIAEGNDFFRLPTIVSLVV